MPARTRRSRGGAVVRTYTGLDRGAAERRYQADRRAAVERGWRPVSIRWTSDGPDHVLRVVYELLPGAAAPPAAEPRPDQRDDGPEARAAGRWLSDQAAPVMPMDRVEAALDAVVASSSRVGRQLTPVPWDERRARARDASRGQVTTLDLHCAGEPLRLVRGGYPSVPDLPILERRAWVARHADDIRRMLMFEPRGHRDMYGAVLLTPHRPDADIAVLFMHNEGYSTMCGHGIIALTQGLIEEGLYPATQPTTTIRWETPAGLVVATAEVRVGSAGEPLVRAVRFLNVPAYLHADRVAIRPRGIRLAGAAAQRRSLSVQIAYGGAYYGIVDAADLGVRVVPERIGELTEAGAAITEELRREHTPSHPLDASLGSVYGTIIVDSDPSTSPDGRARDATIRNVTVFADAEVDRSPCGSGTSAILAARYALGASDVGDELVNAGLTGETFLARVEGVTRLGDRDAILTSVQGRGFVTGRHTFTRDARDPLADGFLLR